MKIRPYIISGLALLLLPPHGHSAEQSTTFEQTAPGLRPAAELVESFDGLGAGLSAAVLPRNPSDNSLAVGPDHIMQTVNSQLVVFTKKGKRFDTTGKVLYGPIATNTAFAGFGGVCEARPNGDTVVRYDQLAERWLIVMPIFRRTVSTPGTPGSPGSDPNRAVAVAGSDPNRTAAVAGSDPNRAAALAGSDPNRAVAVAGSDPNRAVAVAGSDPNRAVAVAGSDPNRAVAVAGSDPNRAVAVAGSDPNRAVAVAGSDPNRTAPAPGSDPRQATPRPGSDPRRSVAAPGERAQPGQAAQPGKAAPFGPPPPLPSVAPRGQSAGAPTAPTTPPTGSYAMCYAISATADPLGPYYRYAFERPLFPDYPRPAVWPDGYYTPTSTGDDVIQKHVCIADRIRMLKGLPATEQCVIVDGVNFLNTADVDGPTAPPQDAPNIVMAAGGTQLKNDLDDDAIFAWSLHVDWKNPARTKIVGPQRIAVAPYHYLCGGQLTNCVPQPGTDRRLDAQGDKIMPRVVYRRIGNQESIVAVQSVDTAAGGGGVRWYEFRLDRRRGPQLYQQGTYAPDGLYRWMASPAMDRFGNIGIGYSFGGSPHFPGQRFAGRVAGDPPGQLTLREAILAEGEASQSSTMRWEDYTQTAVDPSDDCTIWYVGDYLKKDAADVLHAYRRISTARMWRASLRAES